MTVLSDVDLARLYPGSNPGPASIDLHLGGTLLVWPDYVVRDPRTDQSWCWRQVPLVEGTDGRTWTLRPGRRYLAATRETVTVRPDLAAQVAARSSWGRDGLAVICGPAGWVDPGFSGALTLELSVVGSPLVIWPGARVCQLVFLALSSPAERPYVGKYQLDDGPTPSRAHLDAGAPQPEEVPA